MKEKKDNNIKNEDKKKIFIFIVIVVLVTISLSIILILINKKNDDVNNNTTTIKKTTDVFKGSRVYEINYEKSVSYNVEKRYEIKYASNHDNKIIKIGTAYYDIKINDGVIGLYLLKNKGEYKEATGEVFNIKTDAKVKEYIIADTCREDFNYILILDESNNVYYGAIKDIDNVEDAVNSIKKIKTISNVSKIGMYTKNNSLKNMCEKNELIYLDNKNNIRYIENKNKLFFVDAPYRYLGIDDNNQNVIVYNDGKMKYAYGDNSKYLNDGEKAINYKGSFYTNEKQLNMYILGTDGYLYTINNINVKSSNILDKYSNHKVIKIGIKKNRDDNGYAKDSAAITVEFDDEKTLKLDNVYDFELLN